MKDFWAYFCAYFTTNLSKFIWIVLFVCIFATICILLYQKKYIVIQGVSIKRLLAHMMLCVTCSFIFVMTLFGRAKGDYGYHFRIFQSYLNAIIENKTELLLQIVMNIVMYIPFGFFILCAYKNLKYKNVLYIIIICSTSIEIIQGVFRIGFLELDDILSNVIGGSIGILLYDIFIKTKQLIIKKLQKNYIKCERRVGHE